MIKLIENYEKSNNFGRHLGMTLKVIKPGIVEYTMPIEKNLQAVPGVAHGGVVASLIDGTLGVAGLSLVADDNKVVSTIEFKVNYLKPTKINDTIRCIGKVIRSGKSILYIQAEVFNQKDELIACGSGSFNKYDCPESLR